MNLNCPKCNKQLLIEPIPYRYTIEDTEDGVQYRVEFCDYDGDHECGPRSDGEIVLGKRSAKVAPGYSLW